MIRSILTRLVLLAALAGTSLAVWGALPVQERSAKLQQVWREVMRVHQGWPWPAKPVPVVSRPRLGGLDVTLVVTADTHFGWGVSEAEAARGFSVKVPQGIDHKNRRAIQHMNSLAGRPYPLDMGGRVSQPQAVLVAGDLTENGKPGEWERFAAYYGHTGRDGLLEFPVYAGIGNHDFNSGDQVVQKLTQRYGGLFYSWEMGDLHLVCLGEAPAANALRWLQQDLALAGSERPVIVFFHYPLDGPYAENNWFGAGTYRDRLAETLRGFNVLAIFHGHFHGSGYYRWRGYDVYNVGSPKDLHRSFAVVHITDRELSVSSWNYQAYMWWWWHKKPINGARGIPEVRKVRRLPDGTRPAVMRQ